MWDSETRKIIVGLLKSGHTMLSDEYKCKVCSIPLFCRAGGPPFCPKYDRLGIKPIASVNDMYRISMQHGEVTAVSARGFFCGTRATGGDFQNASLGQGLERIFPQLVERRFAYFWILSRIQIGPAGDLRGSGPAADRVERVFIDSCEGQLTVTNKRIVFTTKDGVILDVPLSDILSTKEESGHITRTHVTVRKNIFGKETEEDSETSEPISFLYLQTRQGNYWQ